MAGNIIRTLFVAALLLGWSAVARAQVNRLPPVDTCARDASFVAFRNRLNAAIARRDAAFIISILPENAFSNAGADTGRRGFVRYWRLDDPAHSRFWRALASALRLGCARDPHGIYLVPSMSLHDEDDPDDASYDGNALAIVPGAALRVAPSARARILAILRWDVLGVPAHDTSHSLWVHAWIADNRDGYVRRDQIRSFTDNIAYFQRVRGRWQLVGFATGE